MLCLSKGLCAPAGSLLAGPKEFVNEARLKRKILGGGMRQAGILAAAGIVALTEQRSRLAEDHERAKYLARSLGEIPGIAVKPGETDINMVFFRFPRAAEPERAKRIMEVFGRRRILINAPEGDLFRFVTHYWIGDKETRAVLEACREAFGEEKAR
jgi:threonine aldolase